MNSELADGMELLKDRLVAFKKILQDELNEIDDIILKLLIEPIQLKLTS